MAPSTTADQFKYGIIIDAGSSGSRIYVYRWKLGFSNKSAFEVESVWPHNATPDAEKKKESSLHLLDPNNEDQMTAYFRPMLEGVKAGVSGIGPAEIYLLGTGGMRGLQKTDPTRVKKIMVAARHALGRESRRLERFRVHSSHVGVIPGRAEGIFAWAAWNHVYANGIPMPGILEMGGASMQVAFAESEVSNFSNLTTVCLLSGNYRVYGETWDGFGADDIRKEYIKNLVGLRADGGDIDDPCLPGQQRGKVFSVGGFNYTPIGTGNFTACQISTTALLGAALNNPPIQPMPKYGNMSPLFERRGRRPPFAGLGNYWYTFEFFSKTNTNYNAKRPFNFKLCSKNNTNYDVKCPFDMTEFKAAVNTYCSAEANGVYDKHVDSRCFNAAWIISGLEDGLGMKMTSAADGKGVLKMKHDRPRASWTIGAMALIAIHGDLVPCKPKPKALDPNTPLAIDGSRGMFADDTPFTIDEDAPLPTPAPHPIPLYQLYLPGMLALFALIKLFTWYRNKRSSRGVILLPAEKDNEVSELHIPLPNDQKLPHVSHVFATK